MRNAPTSPGVCVSVGVVVWGIRHYLSPIGVVLGAVFSAAMSTLSSSLSASASALVNDFVLPRTQHAPDSPFALRCAKLATIVFASLQILVGISGLGGDSVVNQVLAIQNPMIGVILGLFVLALGKRPSARASLVGLLGGLIATACLVFVLPMIEVDDGVPLKIAWPWYGLITCTATIATGRVAKLLLGE